MRAPASTTRVRDVTAALGETVVGYLSTLWDPAQAGFRFHERGSVTLLSTSFATQTHYLLNALELMDADAVASRLRDAQTAEGWFVDPTFRAEDLTGSHSATYVQWQTSFFALTALDMLGREPKHRLAFMDPFLDATVAAEWMKAREWGRFWYASNEIMFVLYFLSYLIERAGNEKAREARRRCLDVLDERQNADTGYWGSGDPHDGMYGAAHIYMFYDHADRPIRHVPTIVASTAKLQTDAGLFAEPLGGACQDFDGIEVLLEARRQRPDPAAIATIDACLWRAAHTISGGQDSNGGFPYQLAGTRIRGRMAALVRWRRHYHYSGWRKMQARHREPDTWATYFRSMSLAAVVDAFDEGGCCRSYDLPSWGYLGRRARK